MNSYNGFSPTQRTKALKWFRREQSIGNKPANPECCDICGQTEGHLEWHSEDYSDPFDLGHIGKFGLCYVCHMMLHCRFKNKQAWEVYGAALADNKRFNGIKGRNWVHFRQFCLIDKFKYAEWEEGANTNIDLSLIHI